MAGSRFSLACGLLISGAILLVIDVISRSSRSETVLLPATVTVLILSSLLVVINARSKCVYEHSERVAGLWRSMRHNLVNHLQVLSGWIQMGSTQRAQDHMSQISHRLSLQRQALNSANTVELPVLIDLFERIEPASIDVEIDAGGAGRRDIELLSAAIIRLVDELMSMQQSDRVLISAGVKSGVVKLLVRNWIVDDEFVRKVFFDVSDVRVGHTDSGVSIKLSGWR